MPCALPIRSEEHTSELQSPCNLVCRLLLEKKKNTHTDFTVMAQSPALVPQASSTRATQPSTAYTLSDASWSSSLRATDPVCFFFFNDTAPPEIYPLSLHDALPIYFIHNERIHARTCPCGRECAHCE